MKKIGLNGKKHKADSGSVTTVLYAIVLLTAVFFLLGMAIFDNIEVYQARSDERHEVVQDKESREVIDNETPLGAKKEYRFTLEKLLPGQDCLAFYVVHQYAEVYFDGELIYSLKLQDKSQIGKSTANNWVIIPIYPNDEGKEVCVNIIPAYEAVRNREVNFFVSSKFMVYYNQLMEDLPQILLSLIGICVGISFIIISTFHKYRGNENINLTYLGMFSFAIGLWKITDIRFAPLMFSNNTKVLSYISITMLLISVIPWMLSIKKQFLKRSYHFVDGVGILACCLALIIIILQITNIADLRETLIITHVVIASVALTIVGAVIYEGKKERANKKTKILYTCFMLCVFGVFIDLITYYIRGNSSGILFGLIAFLIYIITMGCMSISEINHKANIDIHTGLFNKGRCNDVFNEYQIIYEPLGIIMFDLNELKKINDAYGHDSGDNLIAEFANILRRNVLSRDFVGRYGGDEFIVVVKDADKQKIDQILDDISQTVQQYNERSSHIHISYACGYALSMDYSGDSLRELFKRADSNMYQNKKKLQQ